MDETTPARHGGTIAHPGGLYEPGTGTCLHCGAQDVPTIANGRIGAHGPAVTRKDTSGRYWVTTCTGWGSLSVEASRA